MKNPYGIIILAAGGSNRLGNPKQLLEFEGTSLLNHVVEAASHLDPALILVVTGAYHHDVEKLLRGTGVLTCYNENWATGMSSSIIKGLSELKSKQPDVKACIVAVCDQPFVTAEILNQLIETFEQTGKGLVASTYNNTIGTPALFDKKYFSELLRLKGDEGAKKLIKQYGDDLALVPFEKGAIDIDTEEDYRQLTS